MFYLHDLEKGKFSLKRRWISKFISPQLQHHRDTKPFSHASLNPSLLTEMVHDAPSIQAFYKPEVRLPHPINPLPSPTKPGDGFTEEELSDALDPLHRKWNPEREYEECGISQLAPGPRAVTFVGRVVNLKTILGTDRKQPKARGFHALILRDDEAAISVGSVQLPYWRWEGERARRKERC